MMMRDDYLNEIIHRGNELAVLEQATDVPKEKHVCPLDCCGCMWRTAFPDSFCLFRAGLLPNDLRGGMEP
jgi:hypothetical protein